MKKTLIIAVSLSVAGSALPVDLVANKAIEFVPVTKHIEAVPTDKDTWPQTQWWDTWYSLGGLSWYTPEDYDLNEGDTVSVVLFIHLEGPTTNFIRADAFYLCGNTNPLAYVMTSGRVDFGQIPENDPRYGWITGISVAIPHTRHIQIDSASRVTWNGTYNCGLPFAGRPDCATLN